MQALYTKIRCARYGHVQGAEMAETVDEITIAYEEDGQVLVREVDKEVLSSGAWATIVFRYQDFDRAKGEYGPDKYTIRRYQKRDGQYLAKSKFNISSAAQAKKLIEVLSRWTGE